jgi:hypothetical protein
MRPGLVCARAEALHSALVESLDHSYGTSPCRYRRQTLDRAYCAARLLPGWGGSTFGLAPRRVRVDVAG